MRSIFRHSCALILLLVMGLGVTLHGAQASCMADSAPVFAGDMSLPGDCNDCDGQSGKMTSGICATICPTSAACALLVPAATQLVLSYAADRVAAASNLHDDWLKPLDPFPPKLPALV